MDSVHSGLKRTKNCQYKVEGIHRYVPVAKYIRPISISHFTYSQKFNAATYIVSMPR